MKEQGLVKEFDELSFEEQVVFVERMRKVVSILGAFMLLKTFDPEAKLGDFLKDMLDKEGSDEAFREENEPPPCKKKGFKVGDKVKIVSLDDAFPPKAQLGDVCEVVDADSDVESVALKWNRNICGWGENSNCWWVTTDCLELI